MDGRAKGRFMKPEAIRPDERPARRLVERRGTVRIGLIATPWVPVPPPAYGGTEAVIDTLARGLKDAGHDVEMFTVGESTCDVKRSWLFDEPMEPMHDSIIESLHVEAAYRAFADVDVIHDHTAVGPFLGSHAAPPGVPVVTTVHNRFDAQSRRLYSRMPDRVSVVAISHPHRACAPEVPIEAVIPHGIDTGKYRVGPGGGGYLVFVGRMSPDKGVHLAIEVARRAGMPLVIMVKMRSAEEHKYFEDVVKPMLGSDIELLFEPEEGYRIDLVGRADALINPIQWPEPFGLVMAESMSCGTPVIATPNGAAQEIVEPGITGYLHSGVDELVAAVGRAQTLDRGVIRATAERRFSMERMVDDHVRLYRRLIDRASVPTLSDQRGARLRRRPVAL
jgi:glycosyltransferase involved in cell wall biosynthesis